MELKKLLPHKAVDFIKDSNKLKIIIILIIGVFLMTFMPEDVEKKEVHDTLNIQEQEERLENILSKINGAGKVEVMITYYGSSQTSIAYETKSEVEEKSRQTDKRAVMSGNSPVVIQELYPKVKGVIVVAQGADDIGVKRALREAVTAAMGVGASDVCVYEKSLGG